MKNTTFATLELGYTYILKSEPYQQWLEIEVLEITEHAIYAAVNPRTVNNMKWFSKEEVICEILDYWETKKEPKVKKSYG